MAYPITGTGEEANEGWNVTPSLLTAQSIFAAAGSGGTRLDQFDSALPGAVVHTLVPAHCARSDLPHQHRVVGLLPGHVTGLPGGAVVAQSLDLDAEIGGADSVLITASLFPSAGHSPCRYGREGGS